MSFLTFQMENCWKALLESFEEISYQSGQEMRKAFQMQALCGITASGDGQDAKGFTFTEQNLS